MAAPYCPALLLGARSGRGRRGRLGPYAMRPFVRIFLYRNGKSRAGMARLLPFS